jgi:hypothetical protein
MASTAVARALVPMLVLALLAAGAPAVHEHRATGATLYDGECSLEQLGAGGPEIGLPRAVNLVASLLPTTIPLAPTPRGRYEALPLPASPRGPPIAG